MNPVATNSNLARLAEAAFERRGDYESLLFEGRWHRSGELFERSCRIAGALAELGVEPGERVVVSMANRPEVSVVYQALWRAGAAALHGRNDQPGQGCDADARQPALLGSTPPRPSS